MILLEISVSVSVALPANWLLCQISGSTIALDFARTTTASSACLHQLPQSTLMIQMVPHISPAAIVSLLLSELVMWIGATTSALDLVPYPTTNAFLITLTQSLSKSLTALALQLTFHANFCTMLVPLQPA